MSKSPTIHDLAADLNISATTVWRALNNRNRVSEKTRERVRARAKAINYEPSLVAQNLSHGRTSTLGVIVPMIGHPIFSSLIEVIEQIAFERGYSVIVGDARLDVQREAEYAHMLSRRRVEGAIVVPFSQHAADRDEHLIELQKKGVAVVILEQSLPAARFDTVVADNFGAAYQMTRHLIQLGHQRIAFAYHPTYDRDPVGNERLAGFNHAITEAGLKDKARLLLNAAEFEEGNVLSYRRETVVACLSGPDRPTAIFAGMDILAIQIMQTVHELGLGIPRDVAVAGFDNIEFSAFTVPALTTVKQPTEEMGRRAAELLFAQIEAKPGTQLEPACVRLPCELIIRQSCGARFQTL